MMHMLISLNLMLPAGVLALFRGIAPSLLRAIVMYGASVPTYDTVKKHIVTGIFDGDVIQGDRMMVHMASSLCSGFVASVVSTPFDTVKTRYDHICFSCHVMWLHVVLCDGT